MASFENCIAWVLRFEDRLLAGVVKDLHDGGGLTRFGIAQTDHPGLPDDFYTGPLDAALATAEGIYRREYWVPTHAGELRTDELAATLLSFAVNDGAHRAVELLQGVLGLAVDGVVGPATRMAIHSISDESATAARLREAQAAFYGQIVSHHPEKGVFLTGWLRRALAVYPALLS